MDQNFCLADYICLIKKMGNTRLIKRIVELPQRLLNQTTKFCDADVQIYLLLLMYALDFTYNPFSVAKHGSLSYWLFLLLLAA